MSDGVCLHCGPDAGPPPERATEPVHGGWKGFDRDLGSHVRRERAKAAREERENEGKPSRIGAIVGTLVSVAVVGGAVWLMTSGRLDGVVPASPLVPPPVPDRLVQAASAKRVDLGLLARALDEVAVDAERKLSGSTDFSDAVIDRFLARLAALHDTGRALEPELTREEGRILMALRQAEKLVAGYVRSFRTQAPELDGGRIDSAREQIARAQAVLRGDEVDDLIVTFTKKANAAKALEKELDRP